MRCHQLEGQKSKTVLEFRRPKSSSKFQSADIMSLGASSADIGSRSTSQSNTVTATNGIQSLSAAEFIADNNIPTRTSTSSKREANTESSSPGVDSKNDRTETTQTIPVIDTRLRTSTSTHDATYTQPFMETVRVTARRDQYAIAHNSLTR